MFADTSKIFTYQGAATAAWLGLVCTAVAYLLFVPALHYLDARSAASLGLAEPVTAVVLALTVLGEKITIPQLIGIALVLAGLSIISAFDRPSIAPPIGLPTRPGFWSNRPEGADLDG